MVEGTYMCRAGLVDEQQQTILDFEASTPAGVGTALTTATTLTFIDTTSNQEIGTYTFSTIQGGE